ncbi:unnamed protein product [Rodentolepis nana]|uniref:Nucleolar protein 9 n=1 Tax=Rodentolepis nana TaxID=102285 RepID=A0A158QHU5_RODNA|nr:unnamed protein product [Rodentolepis nana]
MAPKVTDPRKVKYFEGRSEFLLRHCRPDEKEEFVKTTFMELMKDGWSLCTNGRVANCIEKMVPYATAEAIGLLLKTLTKEIHSVLNTKFAHHVLHAALRHCVENPEFRDDTLISSSIEEYLDFMWENHMTLLQGTHSSPALRIYVQLLAGVSVPKSPHSGLYDVTKIALSDPLDPQTYKSKITELVNVFLLSEGFNNYVRDAMSGAFLQILLIICYKRMESHFEAICSTIFRRSKILKTDEESEVIKLYGDYNHALPMGFSDPVAIFFTETLIGLLPGRLVQKLLGDHILTISLSSEDSEVETKPSIASALAGHENACRVLRAVIRSTKHASDLQSIMSSLQLPGYDGKLGLEVALKANQHYLLIVLAEACRKCTGSSAERLQDICEQMLLEAFGFPLKTKKPTDQLIKAFVRLKRFAELKPPKDGDGGTSCEDNGEEEPHEIKTEDAGQGEVVIASTDEKVTSCQLAGCLLAEEVFGFTSHRPIRLAASLASLPPNEMFAWCRNCMLHRVIESAIISPSVPEQRKLHIFESLKPVLKILATDQSGSRVVEALWRSGDIATSQPSKQANAMISIREELAKALAPASDRIASSKFGRFVENLVGSAAYSKNPKLWREAKLCGSHTTTAVGTQLVSAGKGAPKSTFKRKLPTDFRKLKRLEEKQNKKTKRSCT